MNSSLLFGYMRTRKGNVGFYSILFILLNLFMQTKVLAQGVVKLEAIREKSAVFKKPDFDAEIIYLLPRGQKLVGTRSTVEGLNGLGLFHKVKLNSKTYGYMLDTEVKIEGEKSSKKKSGVMAKSVSLQDNAEKKKSSNSQATTDQASDDRSWDYTEAELADMRLKKEQEDARKKKEAAKKKDSSKDPKNMTPFERYRYEMNAKKNKKQEKPFFAKTMIGAQAGLVNFTEKTNGGKKSSNETVYGFKLSGPNILFNNFLVDLSVNMHFGAPSYYGEFSTEASGFFALVDLTLPFILSRTESRYVYGGVGPVLNMSFFDFTVLGSDESSQKMRLGVVGTFGLAYKLGESWAFKAEGKYYLESASYWGVLAGIQKSF